jgi:VanZ family protein
MYLAFMPVENIGADSDKLNHLLAFIVFVFLISQSFKLNIKFIIFFSFIFAVFIEFVQYFLPYRSAEILDIFADMLGSVIGLFLLLLIYRFKVKKCEI